MNFMCHMPEGDVLVYIEDEYKGKITPEMYKDVLTARGCKINDCYEVKNEEVQYYCIDERFWLTSTQADFVIEYSKTMSNS